MILENHVLPPGPDQPLDLGFQDNALELITQYFEEYGNIFKVYSPSRKAFTYVLSGAAYAQHVLQTNHRNYTKGVGIDRVKILLGDGIMVSEGDYWRRQRRMIQPAFHKKVIEGFAGLMYQENLKLFEKWDKCATDKEPVNITEDMSELTLMIILKAIFSEDLHLFNEWTGGKQNPFELLTQDTNRNLQFAFKFRSLGKVISDLINFRRDENIIRNDFLSMLMESKDKETGEGMSMKELIDEVMTLIVAGHETTASSLSWAWMLIAERDEVKDKLRKESECISESSVMSFEAVQHLSYTKMTLQEAMRLYPTGWLLTRKAIENDKVGEFDVPAGTDVFVCPFTVQRNPEYWDNPEVFSPERFHPDKEKEYHKFAYFPFASGPRKCIGDFLAMTEMQIHLGMASQRYNFTLVPDQNIVLEPQINLRSKESIFLKVSRI